MSEIIDLTYRLDPTTPVFPNYPPVAIEVLESTRCNRPDGRRSLNSTRISVGAHCGTHMDAPFHFIENGRTIDEIPLDQCVGEAVLLDLRNAISDGRIEVKHLEPHQAKLRELRKAVVQTGWSEMWGRPEFFTDHPVFTPEAAQFVVDCGMHLIGVDFPSVDHPPFPAHLAFLGHGIVIVENLTNLSRIKKDVFNLAVLPLKITGRDGSPVRAIAQEVN